MAIKYHIAGSGVKAGTPTPCHAEYKCRLIDEETGEKIPHFDNETDAWAHVGRTMAKKHGLLAQNNEQETNLQNNLDQELKYKQLLETLKLKLKENGYSTQIIVDGDEVHLEDIADYIEYYPEYEHGDIDGAVDEWINDTRMNYPEYFVEDEYEDENIE